MITDDIKTVYNRGKWALVVRGLFGIALGIFIIARPLDSVAAFALVVAIWALVDGIVSMVRAVELRAVAPHWWVMLLAGLVSTLFGIAALYYYPGLSLTFVVLWTALWLITAGVLGVYVAIQERNAQLPWGWTMAFGIVAGIGGILAVMYPAGTLAGVVSLIAAYGIISGVALLIGAGKLRSFERDVDRAVRNPVRT
jgi:uncharacterized membrane protein HdeD (DUF308 family)